MKQLLQYMRNAETVVADVRTPTPRPGMALVRTAASLVSSGTERMVVEFAEKNLVEKAQARPDLVAQLMDKVRREGLLTAMEATLNRLDQPMTLGYSPATVKPGQEQILATTLQEISNNGNDFILPLDQLQDYQNHCYSINISSQPIILDPPITDCQPID
jgi:hypothetical protein